MDEQKPSRSFKPLILVVPVLLPIVVSTAAITYLLTSNSYLDQLDSQNVQIRSLQNALREINGLEPLESMK